MILVDTSVWIDHLRRGDDQLTALLEDANVLMHPFVHGELACGNLKSRRKILDLLAGLPQAVVADNHEVLFFIEHHKLMGRGVGYVDAHLLTAVKLTDAAELWTRDKRLHAIAKSLALTSGMN